MQLIATIFEETQEAAVAAVRAVGDCDGIEVRVEHFGRVDFAALRAATEKPLILTWRNRGAAVAIEEMEPALAAGIDFVDVEWNEGLDLESLARSRDRIVLSHHDFEGLADVEGIFASMAALGCAHTKLAASPQTFEDNQLLLGLLQPAGSGRTVIGMGERGLYARILAPFRGSELAFVAPGRIAAPGQLDLVRALEIYGPRREALHADRVFAVVGNPAGYSLSPSIHNRLFRENGVAGAYTIASVARFDEVENAFLGGEPCGLSVTAPFKEEALAFARRVGAEIGANALDSGAVNTLVNDGRGIVADNTDVDGFRILLGEICGRDRKSVAIVGAGGTARAALLAARQESMHVTLFNRTAGKLGARPLAELKQWDGEIVIDTTPADIDLPARAGMTWIRAAYGSPSRGAARAAAAGVRAFDGLDLLEAQAVRQHLLFMRVFDGL